MENLITINQQTPIEIALQIDNDGMTTAKKLYSFLDLNPSNYSKWAKTNITNNEFATENEDYFPFVLNDECGGRATTDYKLTAHFAKKLSMKGNGEKAEQAREYFTMVEEKAKEMVQSQSIDRSKLSKNMQMFYMLADNQANIELEQKKQSERINKIEKRVDTMKTIMTKPIGDWRFEINLKVRNISHRSGIEHQDLFNQMYGELEKTAHCSLKRLCNNKKRRMEKAGNTKSAIKSETTKLAIIEGKPQLKAIFEGIVKRYEVAYCA